jgi:hypothetical protein
MKKNILQSTAILLGTIITLSAAEPYVKTIGKDLERDGKTYFSSESIINFDNAKIIYKTLTEKDKQELITSKWEDFFFGLEFGRPKRSNAGWHKWEFLKVIQQVGNRNISLLRRLRTNKISIAKIGERTVAQLTFPLGSNDQAGDISITLIQYPIWKEWMFMKIQVNIEEDFSYLVITYNHEYVKNRINEIFVAEQDKEYNISKDGMNLKPEKPGLAMYSKFANEDRGGFIVFEPSDFSKIQCTKGYGTTLRLYPVKGKREFIFAMGYFLEHPAQETVPEFFKNTQDKVYEFMKKIDWDISVDASTFDKLMAETRKAIAAITDAAKAKKSTEQLDDISARFRQAQADNDFAKGLEAENELKKINADISSDTLSQFL